MSRERAKGTRWASAIVAYLREQGWPYAELRNLSGANDRGDIAGVIGVCIEAKNQAQVKLAEWLDEATLERENATADVGVVWFHRRGVASPAGGYVLMDGQQFVDLLRDAGYGTGHGTQNSPQRAGTGTRPDDRHDPDGRAGRTGS